MKFYGLQKTTLIDYPGTVAATLFTGGCNMRCPFCHNPDLLDLSLSTSVYTQDEILAFLQKRKTVLEGVCITGGEPLMHFSKLKIFVQKVREIGLKVKLDTNGTFPEYLRQLKVDYIAMDVKTALNKYEMTGFTGINLQDKIKDSIKYIINSGIDYEFRTTIAPGFVTLDDIEQIVKMIKGASKYVLNQFRPINTLDIEYLKIKPYSRDIILQMQKIIESYDIMVKIPD